ncbi:Glycosyltransferase involved in cell wall bisynthesis [Parasphingorhabdus marina DSM 22363]|uniref:Glycosyltransferase involved in cell wall bisynthesis n=1 Tax=Parasphingorhabdus marina DSM 22363 TaxID=1123272 RepID=A0A1N6HQH8_9SPHN|nr:glycosyltransferase family 4 protein [Parasphingorhabdus marina]SIO22074.1 Glycosyltransferase involved in cell wall bisynthesis [Parasphingorhabdus marina DSM 22363]
MIKKAPELKIAFISQYFHPEPFSNTDMVRALLENGHSVDVFCCVPNYPAGEFYEGYSNRDRREEELHGANVYRAWTLPRGKSKIALLLNYLTFPVTASWQIARKLKQADVALVSMPSPLTQAIAGIFLKRTKGVPLVYWVQDIWPESPILTLNLKSALIVKPLEWICGWIYRQADLVLVQSKQFPAMIERFDVQSNKIRFLPNTAPEEYAPKTRDESKDEACLVPQNGFRLMFAGNIGESQDFDTLIEAARLLRAETALVWVIIGGGRGLESARKRITDLGLEDQFLFLGRHPMNRMPNFFSHADAMLVSLKDNAIFNLTVPFKMQCYLACGKPIVGSLNGEGARILEQSGAGYVAEASSPAKLAETIRKMVSSSAAERQKMSELARTYFLERYSRDKVYGDLIAWLREASENVDSKASSTAGT